MGSTSSKDGENSGNNTASLNEMYYRVKASTQHTAPSEKSA
jgi:hypothetical protein